MPWTISDVDSIRKGLSRKQKKKWVAIANGVMESCNEEKGQDCDKKAVRIANSKFEESRMFNPLITDENQKKIMEALKNKKFIQNIKNTPPDPIDGHVHTAAFDESGNGGTDEAGMPMHSHLIYHFYVEPYFYFDEGEQKQYVSVHPGSIAFSERKMGKIEEMEIFRAGTHNDEEFGEKDLYEIAENFGRLRSDLKPKLKITHHGDDDQQIALAGLASYGDVVEVYVKDDGNGEKRLYAKIVNVPQEVLDWISEGRFAERSIEIYPEFKLGTVKDSPVYRNVLKAVALLGNEMPAVTGMEPIRMSSFYEKQKTICFKEFCVPCEEEADAYIQSLIDDTNFKIKEAIFSLNQGGRG